ncbi:Cdc6/Cdc18 family protein [Halorubrum vacuolatum]|uniref:Cdc6-related protein, AAA superfamily ATPase n=1 Tax=Halorubrum vacuolatum TaxID=63740 RepID=A0A238WZP7_HALVU|nr:AAA family ATPase [Halorubrum vacuolatum]SNR51888.1 Cdc6-related protein, AAA superfamily ATPase [Halorubrum vacuolatum]
MNIDDRIERRLGFDAVTGVVADPDAISPVSHPRSPVGRGPDLERLLDALDPAFAGSLPPSMYIYGPKGSGKSAVVKALFDRLAAHGGRRQSIQTSTRAVEPVLPEFAYVDVRHARTRFRLYHDILCTVGGDEVPDHGIGTEELASTLADTVRGPIDVVVALDHTNEPASPDVSTVIDWLSSVSERIVPVCLSREPPAEIDWLPEVTFEFDRYRHHVLVELLTSRVSSGLTRNALTHGQVREVSEWAAGDAHDALSAITGAAWHAERTDATTIAPEDLDAGIEGVPKPCVALGRVLALSESRQRLLYELVRLSESDRKSVNAATESIAATPAVDLSASTVRRILYELADVGLLDRVTVSRSNGKGRPPSRLVPRFPTLVFRELFERR